MHADRHVNLLVSLLVRYPEISSVHVATANHALELSFLLRGTVEPARIDALARRLQACLDALSALDGRQRRILSVTGRAYRSLTRLVVSRSLRDLAAEEFPIILETVKEAFGDLVVIDEGESDLQEVVDEEAGLDATLEALRTKGVRQEMIGIRDEGRVLVFNGAKL